MDAVEIGALVTRVSDEIGKVVIGQRRPVHDLVVALLAGGHVLLEGVPGTAKTLMVRALSSAVSSSFRRVQFTPDLMPTDIVGVNMWNQETHAFAFHRGPVFADLLLADEINRAPAKTQAALLEAMSERHVTVDGERHPLPRLFTVVATQNPVEYEGTYPLPEAELDRFMLKVMVPYPERDQEQVILSRYAEGFDAEREETFGVTPVTDVDGILAARTALSKVIAEPKVLGYVTDVIRATRESGSLTLGASPRAGVALFRCARAAAAAAGRNFVTPDDVKAMAPAVLRHRVSVAPEVEIEGGTADDVITGLLGQIEVPT
jgi:MoxR-like ATPase